jgi:hypothetical protein
MKIKSTLLLAALALGACTSEPKPPAGVTAADNRKCFWAHQVNNFQAVDENTVYLRVGVRDVYELTMFGPCNDVDWAHRIAITSHGGSSICTGLDAEIIAPGIGSQRAQRCAVRDIRHLTPEQIAALPPKARP